MDFSSLLIASVPYGALVVITNLGYISLIDTFKELCPRFVVDSSLVMMLFV